MPQDWDRIEAWLAGQGQCLDREVEPKQFAGGLANLNYLVSVDGEPTVLRRPPHAGTAEGANDMAREFKVLSALAHSYPLAPHARAFCDDVAVLGVPFQLMEYRPGTAIGHRLPTSLKQQSGAAESLTSGLIGALADLHRLDPESTGLGDLGRKPSEFLSRQVEGWWRRANATYDDHPPAQVLKIVAFLRRNLPSDPRISILHCDFKFDNVLVDESNLLPVAVIDWDMATLGDPLFDLGVLLSYWVQPEDPVELHRLNQVPSLERGFPRRQKLIERYASAADRRPPDVAFYVVLARLRLAIIWQQLHRQHAATDKRYAEFPRIGQSMLAWTADTLHEPRI